MDIKDLNKKQMILLVLLVCFVVSIATGIVTVSLMQQVPKSVPQTINRVIERTITNVTASTSENKKDTNIIGDSNAVVQIYLQNNLDSLTEEEKPLGTGVIISDVGLVLVENSILTNPTESTLYRIKLDKEMYNAEVLQKFTNGFTILKILPKGSEATKKDAPAKEVEQKTPVDIKQ